MTQRDVVPRVALLHHPHAAYKIPLTQDKTQGTSWNILCVDRRSGRMALLIEGNETFEKKPGVGFEEVPLVEHVRYYYDERRRYFARPFTLHYLFQIVFRGPTDGWLLNPMDS